MDQLLTRESLAVHVPLLVFLAVTAYRELATQRIANQWLLPGLIYFAVARLVVGPNSVTDYLGGGAAFFAGMWLLWMFGVLGGGAVKLAAVVGIALGTRLAIATAGLQGIIFLSIYGILWLREKRREQERKELERFVNADHEQLHGATAALRSLASSPFCLAIVLGVLAWQWARA